MKIFMVLAQVTMIGAMLGPALETFFVGTLMRLV